MTMTTMALRTSLTTILLHNNKPKQTFLNNTTKYCTLRLALFADFYMAL